VRKIREMREVEASLKRKGNVGDAKIAEKMGIGEDEVVGLRWAETVMHPLSMEQVLSERKGRNRHVIVEDMIAGERPNSYDEAGQKDMIEKALKWVDDNLKPKHKRALRLWMQDVPLKKIGKEIGVGEARACQIIKAIIEVMQKEFESPEEWRDVKYSDRINVRV